MTRAESLARAEAVWEYIRTHPYTRSNQIRVDMDMGKAGVRSALDILCSKGRVIRYKGNIWIPPRGYLYYVVAGERPKAVE